MKLISILTPTYNEEHNVNDVYSQVKKVMSKLSYEYEHIFIDNASKDRTVEKLKDLAKKDRHVKIIVNARNFGYIRSPYYGLMQCNGDAVIYIVADLQEPPSLIPKFIEKWEKGSKVVLGVKSRSKENKLMFAFRKLYYTLLRKMADIELIDNFTGFGLYDKKIIEILREVDDPYPYLRGLIAERGFDRSIVEFQ
ncbi:MAG: glycosyltransferase family 2 protein [archaeon]